MPLRAQRSSSHTLSCAAQCFDLCFSPQYIATLHFRQPTNARLSHSG